MRRIASLSFFVPIFSNFAFFESGWPLNFSLGICLVSDLFIKLNIIQLQSFRLLSQLSNGDNAETSRDRTLQHSHNAGRHTRYVGATTAFHDRLFKIARTKQTEHAWSRWRAKRNIVKSLNRLLKNDNLKNKLSLLLGNKNDPYKYHTILKNITGFIRQENIPPLVHGDDILSTSSDKAEAFNAYFRAQADIELMDSRVVQKTPTLEIESRSNGFTWFKTR